MNKTLLIALTMACTTGAFAQSTTTTSTTEVKAVEKSPFGLRLINSIGTKRADGKNTGFANAFYVTPKYQIDDSQSLNFDNLFYQQYSNGGELTNEYNYATINYSKSGLMNQKDDGINLSVNARYRAYVNTISNDGVHQAYGRIGTTASGSFTDKLSGYVSQQFAVYQRTNGFNNTNSNYLYTYGGLNYQLSDKLGAGFTGEYFYRFKKGEGATVVDSKGKSSVVANDNIATLTLDVSYQATQNLGLAITAASDLYSNGAVALEDVAKNTNFTFDATFNVF